MRATHKLLLLVLLGGCADRSLDVPPGDHKVTQPGCGGSAPFCVEACGSDFLQAQASCQGGDWTCPAGLQRVDLCPPTTCWGPPASDAEVCTDQGWDCQPTDDDYRVCPSFLCGECTGFPGSVTIGDCTCACGHNEVTCNRVFGKLDPSARFFWTWEGGVVASGGGVEILGDGTVHGWHVSSTITSGPPDFSDKLSPADVADLFARFHAVDLSKLPHTGGGAECYASAEVRDCGSCAAATLAYSVETQVLPEMSDVFAWFTAHARNAITVADFSPATYCNF
jgi:hypothetical protein